MPGPSVMSGFGSLFDRINSLFARLGNSLSTSQIINSLRLDIWSLDGAKRDFCQFLPAHQGKPGQPARRYCTASSRRNR
jgi:hypothetical protein